jgi:hypothetical protein
MIDPLPTAQPVRHEAVLPNGRLRVQVARAEPGWTWQRLCGFAARHNPRRGFLFVSKVLGKHWPSAPAEMAAAHDALAARLPAPAGARPVLFIGMAETATGLGQGVFEAYLARHGEGSAVYVQTTRYPLSDARILSFEERHSHAQSLRLHWPERAELREAFEHASALVLVDDELSTGQTFLSLMAAYRGVNPGLQRVCLVSLTDFMGEEARARWLGLGCEVDFVSLLTGSFDFEADPGFRAEPAPAAQAEVGCRRGHVGPHSARLGTARALRLPAAALDTARAALPAGAPVLVLGTGEFMHPAFCLARSLAEDGRAVRVQSTTRSPILLGADIRHRLDLQDPYGEGIPNYLYNVDPAAQPILLCCETPPSPALADTLARLGARAVVLGAAP